MRPTLIGIAGTNGSGKDTVGQILERDHNYLFVSVSDMLRRELKVQGLPLTREAMRKLSAKWRKDYGLGVLIDKAENEYEHLGGDAKYRGLTIASLRSPAEADSVHKYGGIVLWLDADPRVRYERIQANAHIRGADRAAGDNVSFTDFLADEAIEMDEKGDNSDPTALSLSAVKARSDLFLLNDEHNLGLLREKLFELLGLNTP